MALGIYELVTHSTTVIEKNRIWKQHMEVEEEGERDLTGRYRLRRQEQDGVVAGSRRLKHGQQWQGSGRWSTAAASRAGDHGLSFVPQLAIRASLPPSRGMVAPC
jgi:hypothetical protein